MTALVLLFSTLFFKRCLQKKVSAQCSMGFLHIVTNTCFIMPPGLLCYIEKGSVEVGSIIKFILKALMKNIILVRQITHPQSGI